MAPLLRAFGDLEKFASGRDRGRPGPGVSGSGAQGMVGEPRRVESRPCLAPARVWGGTRASEPG